MEQAMNFYVSANAARSEFRLNNPRKATNSEKQPATTKRGKPRGPAQPTT
jgi:hypothetical protein